MDALIVKMDQVIEPQNGRVNNKSHFVPLLDREIQIHLAHLSYIHLIFLIFLFTFTINCFASPNEEHLNIDSDKLSIDQSSQIATFRGNVIVYFKDMKLKAEIIEVTFVKKDGKNKIDKIVVPVKLEAIKECPPEIAIADQADFDANTGILTLNGKVVLKKDNNILSTNKLIYYTELQLKK